MVQWFCTKILWNYKPYDQFALIHNIILKTQFITIISQLLIWWTDWIRKSIKSHSGWKEANNECLRLIQSYTTQWHSQICPHGTVSCSTTPAVERDKRTLHNTRWPMPALLVRGVRRLPPGERVPLAANRRMGWRHHSTGRALPLIRGATHRRPHPAAIPPLALCSRRPRRGRTATREGAS